MRNLQAKMFDKKASDLKNKPDQILEALELQQGQYVADIGAGGGYFSLRFAEVVGKKGKVYAVDTNQGFLEFIENDIKLRIDNVQTILVSNGAPALPTKVDLVFMRNICHHLSNRVEYFRKLRHSLKQEGSVAIIEYKRAKPFTFRGIFGHYILPETIIEEMKEAKYRVHRTFDFLPEQSFTIFLPS